MSGIQLNPESGEFSGKAARLTRFYEDGSTEVVTPQSVAVRYLLVELPIDAQLDVEKVHSQIQQDVSSFLWNDVDLAEPPTVALVYPGDVVPGGESDG